MTAGNVKGALLEYLLRRLLLNCGFTHVKADRLYSYESGGLFYVNGKGAAHDTDIIVNPPVQMPFAYPTQLIFECKAYDGNAGLPIVRNALGLRNDLNDFEIVTLETIEQRKNNTRATVAVEARNRYLYQVGVASIFGFTKPAIEFSANNKIPLFSMSWFLRGQPNLLASFNAITKEYVASLSADATQNLYRFLKDREGNIYEDKYRLAKELTESEGALGNIISFTGYLIETVFVGLLETGDIIFLYSTSETNILGTPHNLVLQAELHWSIESPDIWELTIFDQSQRENVSTFEFFLPDGIYDRWKKYSFDRSIALDLKAELFSRVFVFNKVINPLHPFTIVNLDKIWLESARLELENPNHM